MVVLKKKGNKSVFTAGDTVRTETSGSNNYGKTVVTVDGIKVINREGSYATPQQDTFVVPTKWHTIKWLDVGVTGNDLYVGGKGNIDHLLNYFSAPLNNTDSYEVHYGQHAKGPPTYLEQLHKLDGNGNMLYIPKSN